MWDLPGPGLEPESPALAGGFLTTAPPRKFPLPTSLTHPEDTTAMVDSPRVCRSLPSPVPAFLYLGLFFGCGRELSPTRQAEVMRVKSFSSGALNPKGQELIEEPPSSVMCSAASYRPHCPQWKPAHECSLISFPLFPFSLLHSLPVLLGTPPQINNLHSNPCPKVCF